MPSMIDLDLVMAKVISEADVSRAGRRGAVMVLLRSSVGIYHSDISGEGGGV